MLAGLALVASLIGASRQKVNAHLRAWARQGLLARDGTVLVIRDPARLRALADAEE